MTTPVFVLRDDVGRLHPCQANAEMVSCDGGFEQAFTVTDSKLTIGIAKDVDIKDKGIVLIDIGQNGNITTARAFRDSFAFTNELRPKGKTGASKLTTPTYDAIFGIGVSGQTIDSPLTKASNFSYIAGIEVIFGGQTTSTTYKTRIAGLPPVVQSNEPQIIDVEKPVDVVIDKPKIKVELPTKPMVEQDTAPAAFRSESLFDTARAKIKDDGQLADYVRFLVNNFKDSTDVLKINLVGKADARGDKVLGKPTLVERSKAQGVPDIYFSGNDQLAHDRAIAVQQWFSYSFKDSRNLDAETKAVFGNLRYAVFVKGTSEDLPVVIAVDVANDRAPQNIPWDDTVAGNTLERENYEVNSTAEMEKTEQKGTWYKFKNGALIKLGSNNGATHLLFALKNIFTDELDWFVEDLDLNRVVNPGYSVVDETDAVYSEPGFDTRPTASPALAAFKDPNVPEEAFRVDLRFNETTMKFNVNALATSISARYIPINSDLGGGMALSPQEKRYLKASILEAVAVPGRQQLVLHVNNISPEAAAVIRRFVVLHVPSDTISVRNIVLIETHEAAKPVSITIGAIAGGRADLSKVSPATNEYMKAWYAAQADAALPVDERSFPGDDALSGHTL